MITKEGIEQQLLYDVDVRVYGEVTSTNTLARELIDDGVSYDTLIAAASQSGGRGRMGRSFFSPSGGLYMSLIIKPCAVLSDTVKITPAAAVAAARAIEAVSGARCEIKWVNDVYISGRKVCGILTEAKRDAGGDGGAVILGIGVNVSLPESGFPEDIRDRAGAVFDRPVSGAQCRLAATIINEFYLIYRDGRFISDFLCEYRERSFVIGHDVDVIRFVGGDARRAKAVAIDDECRLIVQYGDGTAEALGSGDVSIIKKEH